MKHFYLQLIQHVVDGVLQNDYDLDVFHNAHSVPLLRDCSETDLLQLELSGYITFNQGDRQRCVFKRDYRERNNYNYLIICHTIDPDTGVPAFSVLAYVGGYDPMPPNVMYQKLLNVMEGFFFHVTDGNRVMTTLLHLSNRKISSNHILCKAIEADFRLVQVDIPEA